MRDSERKSVQFLPESTKASGGEEEAAEPKDLILVSRAALSEIVSSHFKESLEEFSLKKKKRGAISLNTPSKRKPRKSRKAAILSPQGTTHPELVNVDETESEEGEAQADAGGAEPKVEAQGEVVRVPVPVKLGPQLDYHASPGIKWADLLERTILSTTRILISGFSSGFTADEVRREVNFLLNAE